jgi:hypothetical protein
MKYEYLKPCLKNKLLNLLIMKIKEEERYGVMDGSTIEHVGFI